MRQTGNLIKSRENMSDCIILYGSNTYVDFKKNSIHILHEIQHF